MSGKSLRIDVDRSQDGIVVIDLEGEVDVHTSPRLRETLLEVIHGGADRVVVDARKVTFMDSSGLGVFIGGEKRVRDRKGCLAIACEDPKVMRIFEISGLRHMLLVRESREEALRLAAG